jgi:hypothetical protein
MILVQVREKSITIHFTLNGILQCLIALNLYVFWLLEALVLKRDFWQHQLEMLLVVLPGRFLICI